MTQREIRLKGAVIAFLALAPFGAAHSDPPATGYKSKFDGVNEATHEMISALADATLDSACLTETNFAKVTRSLDAQSRETATRMRRSGIKTLNETKAWKTCKGQAEQALKLQTDMSSAQMWATVRETAKRSARLADNEEIRDGLLVDHATEIPITSQPVLMYPVTADTFLDSPMRTNNPFAANLTVSEQGLILSCEVVSGTGEDYIDAKICSRAKLFLRYRPAFSNGKITSSKTLLTINP